MSQTAIGADDVMTTDFRRLDSSILFSMDRWLFFLRPPHRYEDVLPQPPWQGHNRTFPTRLQHGRWQFESSYIRSEVRIQPRWFFREYKQQHAYAVSITDFISTVLARARR